MTKKISLISFLIFVFLIPFCITWTNIFLYVSMLFVVIDKDLYKKFSLKKLNGEGKSFVFISSVYIVFCVVSLFWSDDSNRGFQLIGRYILIAVFPWFLSFLKVVGVLKNFKQPIYAFILGVLCSSVVCLYLSYQDCWIETENGVIFKPDTYTRDLGMIESISFGFNHFSYNLLSHFIHPSYFSLYFLISFILIINQIFETKKTYLKIIFICFCVYSLVFIYLLQSRSNFIAFICLIFVYVIFYAYLKKRFIYLICGFALVLVVSYGLISDSRLAIIVNLYNENSEKIENNESYSSLNARIIIWRNAIQVIKQHPILGVGIGDTDTELEKQYKKNGVDFEFGTHNQYIYAQLSMGVIGLLLLLAMFSLRFITALKTDISR